MPTTVTAAPPSPTAPVGRVRQPKVYVHPAAQYDGRAGDISYIASIQTARAGARVRGFTISFRRGRCNDGGRYGGLVGSGRERRIDADHDLTVTVRYAKAFWFTRSGQRVIGHEHARVRLHFQGNRVTGSVEDRFVSSHLRCASGLIAFSAFRDGTPKAPFYDDSVETGIYSGRTRAGPWRFVVFLPLHLVISESFHWRLHCPGGKSYPQYDTFYDLPVLGRNDSGQSSFSEVDDHTRPYGQRGDGLTYKYGVDSNATLELNRETTRHGRRYRTYKAYFNFGGSEEIINSSYISEAECRGGSSVVGGPRHGVYVPPDG